MSDDRDGQQEGGRVTPRMHPHDQAMISLFNICTQLAKNCMYLGITLANDPGVNDSTQEAARKVFDSVGPMLDELQKFSEIWKVETKD